MFTDKENVLQLVSLLRAHKISQAVLCPGSRDIPIVQAIAQCEDIKSYCVTDERSAGFFALGVILQTQKPCAVVVTSGSALLNLHPAAAEAYYQQLPLLIISADRAAAWIGQMDGQTIEQPHVLSTVCKYSTVLNEIKDETDRWQCNRSCNEALLKLKSKPYAPVHLNVPISDPFFATPVETLPKVRVIEELPLTELEALIKKHPRTLIILGQYNLGPEISDELCTALAERFAVYCENLCHAWHEDFLCCGDLTFSDELLKMTDYEGRTIGEALQPELVITLGGHIISKKLKQFLRKAPIIHVHVSEDGAVADLFCQQRYTLKASVLECLTYLSELEQTGMLVPYAVQPFVHQDVGYELWQFTKMSEAESKEPLPVTMICAMERLFLEISRESIVHLANSTTVRCAEYFDLFRRQVFSNRGVNGIEGSLSCAMGAACAGSNRVHYMLIGDLSFFYDMNAIWQENPSGSLRIMLFNNKGGEIFSALPGLELDAKSRKFICTPHQTSALPWARERGFTVFEADTLPEFSQALESFTAPGTDNRLLQVNTDSTENLKQVKLARQLILDMIAGEIDETIKLIECRHPQEKRLQARMRALPLKA